MTGNHDKTLIKEALSLLVADRQGLSERELLSILATEDRLTDHLHESSCHEWRMDKKRPMLPEAFWSRIYADFSFFIRMRHGKSGSLLSICHDAFAAAIWHLYMENGVESLQSLTQALIYTHLSNFYKDLSSAHAIMEMVHSSYNVFRLIIKATGDHCDNDDTMLRVMTNPHFLQQKLLLDKKDLMGDFDLLAETERVTGKMSMADVTKFRNDVSSIEPSDWEHFVMQCLNLHEDSMLRKIVEADYRNGISVLHDTLCSSIPYDITINSSSESGSCPRISDDGTRLMSLFLNDHQVKVEDMVSFGASRVYNMKDKIIAVEATPDMRIHAILTRGGLCVYDCMTQETLCSHTEISNPTWVSISDDGSRYVYGNTDEFWENIVGFHDVKVKDGKFSPSGRYLWLTLDDFLCRIDVETGKERQFRFGDQLNQETQRKYSKIIASSDDMAVLQVDNLLFYAYTYINSEQKAECVLEWRYLNVFHEHRCIGAIRGHKVICLDGEGLCMVCSRGRNKHIDEQITHMHGVSAISSNGKFVYSSGEQKVYEFDKLVKTFSAFSWYNVGINTLSSDLSGDCLAVTCGINEMQEHYREFLLAEGRRTIRKVELSKSPVSYYSSCCVSPSGDRIWLSVAYETGVLCMINRNGHFLSEIKNAGFRRSINYTDDGEFVVAFKGHMIADYEPEIIIADKTGRMLRRFIAGDWGRLTLKGHFILSHCNRYAITNELDIIDLIEERPVYLHSDHDQHGEAATNCFASGLAFHYLFAYVPLGLVLFGNATMVSFGGEKTIKETTNKIIACSHSGRYLFTVDVKYNLYCLNFVNGQISFMVGNVNVVLPTLNERYIYVQQRDHTILFIDIYEKRVLQQAFLPDCYHLKVNYNGLAAVTGSGKLCQFEPDSKYNLHNVSSVTIAKRWNLATKRQSLTPTVVCPACGKTFEPRAEVLRCLTNNPAKKLEDWDAPILLTNCPACHARLKLNPFIVE